MLDINKISAFASMVKSYRESRKNNRINFDLNLEAEAEVLFNEINGSELNDYLTTIISLAIKNRDALVEDYYNNRIDEIFGNYMSSEIDDEISSFIKEIGSNKRADNSIFNKVYDEAVSEGLDGNELISFLTRKAQDHINLEFTYTNKIIELSSFEFKMKSSIINKTLFEVIEEMEICQPSAFEKIFIYRGDFHKVKNQLLEKNYLFKEKGKYYWKGSTIESDLTSKKLICTLGVVLNNKNYLTTNIDSDIVTALNSFFANETITKVIYGRYRKEFEDLDNRKESLYYKFYSFIPDKR